VRNLGKWLFEIVVNCAVITAFWYMTAPPETWVNILCLTCIWITTVPIICIACGLLFNFKGPFTSTEKRSFRKHNNTVSLIIHTISAFLWSYILFDNGYIATGMIYTVAIIAVLSVFMVYLYSKQPPPIYRMTIEDIYEYLCERADSIDCQRN